jgi:hypothetical protein
MPFKLKKLPIKVLYAERGARELEAERYLHNFSMESIGLGGGRNGTDSIAEIKLKKNFTPQHRRLHNLPLGLSSNGS